MKKIDIVFIIISKHSSSFRNKIENSYILIYPLYSNILKFVMGTKNSKYNSRGGKITKNDNKSSKTVKKTFNNTEIGKYYYHEEIRINQNLVVFMVIKFYSFLTMIYFVHTIHYQHKFLMIIMVIHKLQHVVLVLITLNHLEIILIIMITIICIM